MTEDEFTKKYGRKPELDDLDRINCDQCGEVGHYLCGVCSRCGQPRWECNHFVFQADLKLSALRKERVVTFPENHRATARFTCDGCEHALCCEYAYDTWNTEGACLADA